MMQSGNILLQKNKVTMNMLEHWQKLMLRPQVVRNFLGQEEMARVLSETDAYEQQVLPQLPPHTAFFSDPDDPLSVRYWDFEATHQHAPDHDISLFAAMPRHSRFAGLATACLGEPAASAAASMPAATSSRQGEGSQSWTDACSPPPSAPLAASAAASTAAGRAPAKRTA